MARQRCCTKESISLKYNTDNRIAGRKITLGDLNSRVFLTVTVLISDARGEYSSFPVHEGLNAKLLQRKKKHRLVGNGQGW